MASRTATPWVLVVEDLRDRAELIADFCAEADLNVTTAAIGAKDIGEPAIRDPRSFSST